MHACPIRLLNRPSSPTLQLLFLAGITLLIGPQKTVVFFTRRSKWRGTACFLGGIVTVLIGPNTIMRCQRMHHSCSARNSSGNETNSREYKCDCLLSSVFPCHAGYPVIGMLIEIFGIFNLFGSGPPAAAPPPHSRTQTFTELTPVCVDVLFPSLQQLLPDRSEYLPQPPRHRAHPQPARRAEGAHTTTHMCAHKSEGTCIFTTGVLTLPRLLSVVSLPPPQVLDRLMGATLPTHMSSA